MTDLGGEEAGRDTQPDNNYDTACCMVETAVDKFNLSWDKREQLETSYWISKELVPVERKLTELTIWTETFGLLEKLGDIVTEYSHSSEFIAMTKTLPHLPSFAFVRGVYVVFGGFPDEYQKALQKAQLEGIVHGKGKRVYGPWWDMVPFHLDLEGLADEEQKSRKDKNRLIREEYVRAKKIRMVGRGPGAVGWTDAHLAHLNICEVSEFYFQNLEVLEKLHQERQAWLNSL